MNSSEATFNKDLQYYKFCLYGFLKSLRFFVPFLILFFLEKGMTFLQIGTLYAIREIGTNIFEVPSGFLADVLGRRKTMVASFLFYIMSFILFYFGNDYLLFSVAMMVFALGEAFRTGVHKAMIFEYLKLKGWAKQKVYYYGHTRSWSQIGSAVSSLLAGVIVFYDGAYQAIFLYSIVPYILGLFLMISYPKVLEGTSIVSKDSNLKDKFQSLWQSFYSAFKSPVILQAVGNISLFSGFYKAVKDYLQPVLQSLALSMPLLLFWEEKERTAIVVGLIYFIIFMLGSFTSRNAGGIASKFQKLQKPINISLLLALSFGLLSGLFFHWGFVLLSIILYLFIFMLEGLQKPMGIAFFADRIDTKILASALSAQSQIKTIWASILAILLGFFVDQFGVGIGLAISSGVMILFLPVLWLRDSKRKHHGSPES